MLFLSKDLSSAWVCHPLWSCSIIMPWSNLPWMIGSVCLCQSFIWLQETWNVHGPIFDKRVACICRSVADRQAGSHAYPKDDQAAIPLPALENQCRRRRDYIYVRLVLQSIFSQFPSHLLYKGGGCEPLLYPVCDSSGMANIQLLHPWHIISGQSVTAGRSREILIRVSISQETD